MFRFENLHQVELEITNRCQASCPMCARNIHGGIDNPSLKISDWTLEDFTTIFDKETVKNVESFWFCGSFGDPIINNDFLDMCKYVKQENPEAQFVAHTNGSFRNPQWWKELAEAMPTNHRIFFALDGIDHATHVLHRQGTFFDKVIENAKSFIEGGGVAVWNFIRFKHNEHQVDEARQMSKELGFKDFSLKDTRRFDVIPYKVIDSKGHTTHLLEPGSTNKNGAVNMTHIEKSRDNWSSSKDIYCYAKEGRNVYIDAHKTVLPCCIKASFMYMDYDKELFSKYGLYDPTTSTNDEAKQIQKQVFEILEEFGGIEALDARKGLKNIINSKAWQTIWTSKWETNGSKACSLMCSKASPYIEMGEQFVDK